MSKLTLTELEVDNLVIQPAELELAEVKGGTSFMTNTGHHS